MFANAYKIAKEFVRPVFIFRRFFDKTVDSVGGAFVIINNEGWIITVAHLFGIETIYKQHQDEILEYNNKRQLIQHNNASTPKQKNTQMKSLKINPKWITEYLYWWGGDGVQLENLKLFPGGDLAVGQLKPFDSSSVKAYPVFKNPSSLDFGTSLCKLGYPFNTVQPIFDEADNSFKFPPNTPLLQLFPIEGIYTRDVMLKNTQDGKHEIKLLETSSPGLRGQSGGPIFDVKGSVWSIQSRTSHYPLGFNPKYKATNGEEIEEHQFLNAGQGIHPELIVACLKDNGIKFNLSEY